MRNHVVKVVAHRGRLSIIMDKWELYIWCFGSMWDLIVYKCWLSSWWSSGM